MFTSRHVSTHPGAHLNIPTGTHTYMLRSAPMGTATHMFKCHLPRDICSRHICVDIYIYIYIYIYSNHVNEYVVYSDVYIYIYIHIDIYVHMHICDY